jgi:hypothetical protein
MPYTKEKKREYDKKYNQTPQCKKSMTISRWKRSGMIGDLSFIYDNDYLNCKACWVCNTEFSTKGDKCCDHNHTTGEFRQVLCQKCNRNDSWMNHSEWV